MSDNKCAEENNSAKNDAMTDDNVGVAAKLSKVILIYVVGGICALAFMFICGFEDSRTKEVDVPAESTIEDIVFSTGYVVEDAGAIVFNEWYAYEPDKKIDTFDERVILKNSATGECIEIPTKSKPLPDFADRYPQLADNEFQYERGWFEACCMLDKLKLDETSYDIILYYNNNDEDKYYYTGYVLEKGGVVVEK